jgi:hypothetical protein
MYRAVTQAIDHRKRLSEVVEVEKAILPAAQTMLSRGREGFSDLHLIDRDDPKRQSDVTLVCLAISAGPGRRITLS